jgi:hypothetical protein
VYRNCCCPAVEEEEDDIAEPGKRLRVWVEKFGFTGSLFGGELLDQKMDFPFFALIKTVSP